MEPIGTVASPVTEPVDEGWGDVVSEIRLRPELAAGLRGLDGFSHALILFELHDARFDPAADLVRHPRGDESLPLLGIFAQRARHRPNRIAVTAVRIERVDEASGTLAVRGLDAIDGTPVLDIKPYVPAYDARPDATTPAWVDTVMEDYF